MTDQEIRDRVAEAEQLAIRENGLAKQVDEAYRKAVIAADTDSEQKLKAIGWDAIPTEVLDEWYEARGQLAALVAGTNAAVKENHQSATESNLAMKNLFNKE